MNNQAIVFSNGVAAFWEQIIGWYQNSTLNDILSYIGERYYNVEFGAYEYFSFGPGANETAQTLILALAFGFIVAAIVMAYTRTRLGGFVRKLLKDECLSPEKAKTLYELGYFRNATIRREFSRGVTLKKLVLKAEDTVKTDERIASLEVPSENLSSADEQDSEIAVPNNEAEVSDTKKKDAQENVTSFNKISPVDFTTARFYIPEDLKYRAEIRFERRGSGWLPVLLTVVGSLIGAALVCKFLPGFIGLLDQLIILTAP